MAITTDIGSPRGFKHHPGVSLDVVDGRLKVRLRMAVLTSARGRKSLLFPPSLLPLACKSLVVLTRGLALGQAPRTPAPRGAQPPWGSLGKTLG